MRLKRIIKINFICCLFVLLMQMTVWAADTKGSVTLQFSQVSSEVEMSLFVVADYVDGGFVYREEFADSGLTISNLKDTAEAQKAAEALTAFVAEHEIERNAAKMGEDGTICFKDLSSALYLVAQTGGQEQMEVQSSLIPIPYTSDSEQGWIYDAVVSPKHSFPGGAVIVRKVDDEGNVVGQAEFNLQQKIYVSGDDIPQGAESSTDENGSFYWKEFKTGLISSEQGQIVLTDMPIGEYRLIETATQPGLVLIDTPNYFSIEKAGEVKEINGMYTAQSGTVEEVTVINPQTKVSVQKVDESGNAVAGAKLVVKTSDGQVAKHLDDNTEIVFVSEEGPYDLRKLPAGDYLLSEIEAPEGYLVSEDVPFTVDGKSEESIKVTMVDKKEKTTNASLKVTKTLADQHGYEMMAEDETFYVALFADAQRTERVSSVKALHFKGSSSSTVTFENLVLNQTYYLGETDQFGILIPGAPKGNGVFAPIYPDDYSVTPTAQETEFEIEFQNQFFELPPSGYMYSGTISITKKVMKGSAAYKTNETFYAAVFEDAAYTKRVGDVIELKMDGKSQITESISVYVGDAANENVTYYIAETDAKGNVLNSSSGLDYQISIDSKKVTMSPENAKAAVTITNTYEADNSQKTGGTGNTNKTGTSTKTGDTTPIAVYAGMMMMALLAAAAVLIRKKGNK